MEGDGDMEMVAHSLNRHRAFSAKYCLTKKIGSGSFGSVYQGTHLKSDDLVAVKLAYKIDNTSALMNEARLMVRLQRSVSLPKIRTYGHCAELNVNYIVMERLGICLYYDNINKAYLDASGGGCANVGVDIDPDMTPGADVDIRSAALIHIFSQLLSIMQRLHEEGFVYRDVKPSNFMLGLPPKDKTVYMIDLGSVKCFRDIKNGKHLPMRSNVRPVGTTRYMSSNAHRGIEQSRRDDLESLGYLFQYLYGGTLPWDAMTDKTDHAAIAEMKESFNQNDRNDHTTPTNRSDLQYKVPYNILAYIHAVSNIGFYDTPEYGKIIAILSHAILF